MANDVILVVEQEVDIILVAEQVVQNVDVGVADHNQAINRSLPDQHPQSAITDLVTGLLTITTAIQGLSYSKEDEGVAQALIDALIAAPDPLPQYLLAAVAITTHAELPDKGTNDHAVIDTALSNFDAHASNLLDPHKTVELINNYTNLLASTSTPTPYVRTLIDSSSGEVIITLPAVLPGDTRWYDFFLQKNSNHCSIVTEGGACLIDGMNALNLSTEKTHVIVKADGVDCYELIGDTRLYDRVIEVVSNLNLPNGFESGAIYYGEPADGESVIVTIANFNGSLVGDFAKFVKKTGVNATYRVVSVDQTFDETINNDNKGFTISVSPTGYIISQDSRPVASNIQVTFFPTSNSSIFEPSYAFTLETSTQPEEVVTTSGVISDDSANPTSLGYWMNDNKALVGDLTDTPMTISGTLKLNTSYNRVLKVRFRYYEYDFGTGTLNNPPLSTTSYSVDIVDSAVFQKVIVSGILPANSWTKNDGSSGKLLVIELQAFKTVAGGDNPALDFISGGENASSAYLNTPFANVNHNTLGGVVHANLGVPDGHVNSKYPLQLPTLTDAERDTITPVAGMVLYNSELEACQKYFNSGWVTEATTHKGLLELQGGNTDERYHLSLEEYTYLTNLGSIFQIIDPGSTHDIDLDKNLQFFTNTGNFTFNTSNRSATVAKITEVRFKPVGADITPTFNASWGWAGVKPATITDGSVGVLVLSCAGSEEGDVLATYEVLGDGSP